MVRAAIQTHYPIAVFAALDFRATLLSACALRECCAGGCLCRRVRIACERSKKNKIIIIWKRYQISSLSASFHWIFFCFFAFLHFHVNLIVVFSFSFFFFKEWRERANDVRKRAILSLYLIFYFVFKNCVLQLLWRCGCRPQRHLAPTSAPVMEFELTRRQNANDKGKEMESVSWLMVHWKQLRCHKADSGGYTQRTTNMKWTENKSFYLCRIDDKSVQWHSTASTLLSIVVLAAAGWVWRWAKNCRLIK